MKKGVTLIQLMVVLVVIGILSAIAIPNVKNIKNKAQLSNVLENKSNVQKGIDRYYLDKKEYPSDTQPTLGNPVTIDWGKLEPPYLIKKPSDLGRFYYWIDVFGTVWVSDIDSPLNLTLSGQTVSFDENPNASDYQVGYAENIAFKSKSDINAGSFYVWLKKGERNGSDFTANAGKVQTTITEDMSGKILLVNAVSKNGLETAPVTTTYTGSMLVGNNKPIAKIIMTPSSDILTTTSITWDSSTSTDPDDDNIVMTEWKLDGVTTNNPNGKIATGGAHTMQLRVKDDKGSWSDWDTKNFNVTVDTREYFPQTTVNSSPLGAGTAKTTSVNPTLPMTFTGTWAGTATSIPSTLEVGAYVTIPFSGTGVDIELYSSSSSSNNITVTIDGIQYPSSSIVGSSSYYYRKIARNLENTNHTLVMTNNTTSKFQIRNIDVYSTPTAVTALNINGSITNGSNTLTLTSGLGCEKYAIFRSKTPGINVDTEPAYDVISKVDFVTKSNIAYTTSNGYLAYNDTNHTAETYYYKIIGVDGGGYRWISNEVSIVYPSSFAYLPGTLNTFLQPTLNGTWTNNGNIASTNKLNDSAQLKFYGTGIDFQTYYGSSESDNIEVWIDGIQYPTISVVGPTGTYYRNIARNLSLGSHILQLINKTNSNFQIREITVYTTMTTPSALSISGALTNGANTLTIVPSGGAVRYDIYRSQSPSIDVDLATVYESIQGNDTKTKPHINLPSSVSGNIAYSDPNHTAEVYYYKVVSVDAANNKWISAEIMFPTPANFIYGNDTLNNFLKPVFVGTWTGTTLKNTLALNSTAEYTFRGTALDIEFYTGASQSDNIEVFVDDVSVSTITTVGASGYSYKSIATGLSTGTHKVKLVNKVAKSLSVRSIKVYN